MLKTIHFLIGTIGITFPVKQFYRLNSDIFNKNKIYHIELKDLYPDAVHNFMESISHDDWFLPNSFKKDISFSDILEKLSDYITEKDIEQLIIFLDISFFSEILPYFYEIKNKFSDTSFTCKINTCNSFNDEILLLFFRTTFSSAFYLSTRHIYFPFLYTPKKAINFSEIFQKIFNIPIEISQFNNSKDFFDNWLLSINFEMPEHAFIPHSHFSQEVISYLLALHSYYKIEKSFDITSEKDFLNYNLPSQNSNTEQTASSFANPSAVFKPELEHAIILSQKLSQACRQKFLKYITLNDVNYMPQASKIVYLSLFLAEKQISLEEIHTILTRDEKKFHITLQDNTQSQEPILTVYTTSYNSKKYIGNCIESIAAQKTKYPFIHLISDDNSSDGTRELLLEYAQKYPHIQLILRNHNDIGANYYGILSSLSTKYAAVCDADDFYTNEQKIEKQINFLEENPDCGLCFHPTYMYYENENTITGIYPNYLRSFTPKKFYYLSNIITTNLMQSSSVMYRWKWKDGITNDFPCGYTPLDWGLNIIHAYNSKIGFINEPMSLYRRHKEAYYALTETNVPLHLITNCFNELYFITILNNYTERKYEKLFLEKAFRVLYNFYITAQEMDYDKEKYNAIKKNIEQYFPDYIVFFKNAIATIQNTTK